MKTLTLTAVTILALMTGSTACFAGDAVAGKTVFGKCALCHGIDPAKKTIGPTLFGVVGRASGAIEGYLYSPAMKAAGKTWDEATLDGYLADPKTFIPGNKMTFAGLPKPEDRANVIAYLATLK